MNENLTGLPDALGPLTVRIFDDTHMAVVGTDLEIIELIIATANPPLSVADVAKLPRAGWRNESPRPSNAG
jgi:hypothetical protein